MEEGERQDVTRLRGGVLVKGVRDLEGCPAKSIKPQKSVKANVFW
jgi:hypothetical protein